LVLEGVTGEQLRLIFEGGLASLAEKQQEIDRLNVFPVPDGDTGRNMYLTIQAAVEELGRQPAPGLSGISEALARGSLMGARGNSGVIFSQLIRGFADAVRGNDAITMAQFAKAWQAAVSTAYHAVMKPVEGTMLTVARGFSQGLGEAARTEPELGKALLFALKKGNETLQLTPELLPVLKKAGVVDAGGKGLLVFLEGGLKALSNGSISPPAPHAAELLPAQGLVLDEEDEEDFTFTYCVEFLLRGDPACVGPLRSALEGYGGSLIVGNDDDVIKVHLHSNHPGEILEHCLEHGTLHRIQISNMRDQWEESRGSKAAAAAVPKAAASAAAAFQGAAITTAPGETAAPFPAANTAAATAQGIGVVAVAAGEGVREIFRSLGAVQVIEGGQTMNPPVEEFVKAIESVRCQEVLVLPNNKNLIMAAEQAKKLVDRSVKVLPTTSVQAGMAALLAFNLSLNLDANVEKMQQAAGSIKAAEITYAVRDANLKDTEIKEGELIGLCKGEIVAVGDSLEQVAMEVIDRVLDEQDELVTLLSGEEVAPEEAERIASLIRGRHPGIEVEVQTGGQPVYYFLISVE
jgi:DAK2 domain fusion protein YloV